MNPLQAIRDEIDRLEKLKCSIEGQLSIFRESEKALAPVYKQQPYISALDAFPHGPADAGLTQRIRQVLSASYPGHTAPTAIRDLLVNTGQVDPQGRSNFLAEIHNILKRLVMKEEAEDVTVNGIKAYRAILRPFAAYQPGLKGLAAPSPSGKLSGPAPTDKSIMQRLKLTPPHGDKK